MHHHSESQNHSQTPPKFPISSPLPNLSLSLPSFFFQALKNSLRIDGRTPFDYRPITYSFSLDDSSCLLSLGSTTVLAAITATLDTPFSDRQNEGSIRFTVTFSPAASPAFGAPSSSSNLGINTGPELEEYRNELTRLIERGLRDSRAVDREALCVVAGRKVWHLNITLTVLDNDGNLADACGLAALAVLSVYRRNDVTINNADTSTSGSTRDDTNTPLVVVHSKEDREPLPLTLHHFPLPVTFALFEDGDTVAVDPTLKEQAACRGQVTITVNPQGEICALQKADGIGLSASQIMRCIRIATQRMSEHVGMMKKALEVHGVSRVAQRVRRRAENGGGDDAGVDQMTGAVIQPVNVQEIAALETFMHSKDDDGDASMETSSSEEEEDEIVVAVEEQNNAMVKQAGDDTKKEDRNKKETISNHCSSAAAEVKETRKRFKNQHISESGDDPFADIATMIAVAGSGGQGQQQVSRLEDAVKKKK